MNTQVIFHDIQAFLKEYPQGVIILYGPTASGKSSLSLELGAMFAHIQQQIEVISADSRQIYRLMDIGTDKLALKHRSKMPHYGFDVVDPDERYTAYQRQQSAKHWIQDIQKRGSIPLVVGGTGLYIDTLYKNFSLVDDVDPDRARREQLQLQELQNPGSVRQELYRIDPVSAEQLHPNNLRYIIRALEIYEQSGTPKSILAQERDPDWPVMMIHLSISKDDSLQKITNRVDEMIQDGLIDEVRALLDQGYTGDFQAMNGIGYRQTLERLETGSSDLQELKDSIVLATTRYAKRQRSWFRRYQADALDHPKTGVIYKTYQAP